MSTFEFVTVLISMILALAVGQLLAGAAALVKNRRRTRGYLTHSLWLANLFLSALLLWWTLWDLRGINWTAFSYSYVVAAPTIMFFTVALLIPDDAGGREVDLQAHFFQVRLAFLGAMLAYTCATWFDGPLLAGQAVLGRIGQADLLVVAGIVGGLLTESRRYHLALAAFKMGVVGWLMLLRFLPGAGT